MRNQFYSLLILLVPEVILSLAAMCALFVGFNPNLDKSCPCKNFSVMLSVIGSVLALGAIFFIQYILKIESNTLIELHGIQVNASILGVKM